MFPRLSGKGSRRWRWQRPARIQPDAFFTDPAVVEDDYGRMKPEPGGRW